MIAAAEGEALPPRLLLGADADDYVATAVGLEAIRR